MRLGFNPTYISDHWGTISDIKIISGITIPWINNNTVEQIKIRCLGSSTRRKYMGVKGGKGTLYKRDNLTRSQDVILVEGEFDALSLVGRVNAVPLATGGYTGARTPFVEMLLKYVAGSVYLAFDQDEAGDEASRYWKEKLGDKAIRLAPIGHDVNEMVVNGYDVKKWLMSAS